MSTLEKAIEIAARAHAGQSDKGGAPYILHPLRVMQSLTDPTDRIVAVLHDVLEDTHVTTADLRCAGFGDDVLIPLEALTKRRGERRIQAAARAAAHPTACRVKIADVADNSNLSRITSPSAKDHERLQEYSAVSTLLRAALADHEARGTSEPRAPTP